MTSSAGMFAMYTELTTRAQYEVEVVTIGQSEQIKQYVDPTLPRLVETNEHRLALASIVFRHAYDLMLIERQEARAGMVIPGFGAKPPASNAQN